MNSPRKSYSVIRDPVHGDLYVSREEMRILDTPQMQRLRGVRQLGTAYLVFPGAQHTRFEHSLGTLHLTSRLIDAVNLNRGLAPGDLIGIPEDEARILRAAALVHDVTHIPFGHNIEDQSGLLERHDSKARYEHMFGATELGEVLADLGLRDDVLSILLPPGEGPREVPPYWRELLSDTICADILDYLKRDAYHTGLNLLYDERVLNYFMVDRQSGHLFVDLAKRGLLREDILSELVRVLEARYFFSERVYYHHAKIAAGAMIAQVVELALREGGLEPARLYQQTDESLLMLLADHAPPGPAAAARYQGLLEGYRSRRLLKRACVYPRYANREVQDELVQRFFTPGDPAERRRFEDALAEQLTAAGIEPPLLSLYCPAREMQLKEAQTHVRHPGAPEVQPLARLTAQLPRLQDLEKSYRDLWKLYLLAASDDPRTLRALAAAAADLLPQATSVYQPAE